MHFLEVLRGSSLGLSQLLVASYILSLAAKGAHVVLSPDFDLICEGHLKVG